MVAASSPSPKENAFNNTSNGGMRSVTQVLRTLDYLATCSGAGVTEVAKALGVHKSTASRLLATMRSEGYVTRSDVTGKYSLGIRIVELAQAKLDQFDIRSYARPYMEELSRRTEETIHLAVLEKDKLVYVDKIDTTHLLVMRSRIGYRISPHCTALGKTILAILPKDDRDAIIQKTEFQRFTPNTITDPAALKEHLQQVAAQGFAFDDEEHEEGIRCAAAPIQDHSGSIIGAISISAPITRMSKQRMEEMGILVKDVCSRLSTSLGYKAR